MKFLKNLFHSDSINERENGFDWIDLHSSDQLEVLNDTSYHHSQLIFKHSTSCGISGMVKRSFQTQSDLPEEGISYYLLDLLRYRDISNAIAEKYNVRHESPQVLVIRNGEVVAHGSHHNVSALNPADWV